MALAVLVGCGTPGAPQPPSLKLPAPVTDLNAVRAGDRVTLHWTTPKRDTDRVALKGPVTAVVCRRQAAGASWEACVTAGTLEPEARKAADFVDTLPGDAISGAPRPLQYFVELKNRRGRSAGQSNAAVELAGAAPGPVAEFAAAPHPDGLRLNWTPGAGGDAIRLYRRLVSEAPKKQSGPLAAPKELAEQKLMIDVDSGKALDAKVSYGATYEYRAQRIARVEVGGRTLELAGEISAPVLITVEDTFPPGVPEGLAAVATAEPGAPPAIDLSWLPRTERNLAGYVVYRREGDRAWQRISPAAPVVGPAFHDAHVEPGHSYRYAVASVSLTGHESARSAEAEERVPER